MIAKSGPEFLMGCKVLEGSGCASNSESSGAVMHSMLLSKDKLDC